MPAPPYDRDQFTHGKRLIGFTKYQFSIRTEDGLAIHGSETGLEIGSTVEPNLRVIVNPRTSYPYIPGSSLKGKLRSTLEKLTGRYESTGKPCPCGGPDCPVCVIFGVGKPTKKVPECAPTRIIVRDAQLTKDSLKRWVEDVWDQKPALELKTESSSNRTTGAANNPRTGERVPPETEFLGEIILREFEGDDGVKFLETIKKVMKFVEDSDGLGSGVSRGSGRISFHDIEIKREDGPSFS